MKVKYSKKDKQRIKILDTLKPLRLKEILDQAVKVIRTEEFKKLREICREINPPFFTYRIKQTTVEYKDKVYRYEYLEVCKDSYVSYCYPVLRVRANTEEADIVKALVFWWNIAKKVCDYTHFMRVQLSDWDEAKEGLE